MVHLVEGRVELGALEVFQSRQRAQNFLFILKLREFYIVSVASINVTDGDMTLAKILEILEILHKMTAGKQDGEWALDHANSLRTRRLHVRVLECEREDELEQRLGNVELE